MWAAGLVLAIVQAALLVRGYRIAPDDAMFYSVALSGWDSAKAQTWEVAIGQGRIGAFVIIPINIMAAYLSDHLAFRWLCAGLYFLVFLLFSLWTARVLAASCASAVFLLLVALNVTDYFHFAPVSFPLQNTIPFLAVVAGRMLLLRPPPPARCRTHLPTAIPGMALFAFGMLATEYGFLLGSSMLAFEMARHRMMTAGLVRPRLRVVFRRFAGDVAVCLLILATYFAWRAGFPSGYDGNQMAALTRLPQGVATGLAHVVVPFALPYANVFRPMAWPAWYWIVAALAPGVVAGLALHAARDRLADIRRPLAVAGVATACAFYVVMPVAMTLKQQERCFQRFGCAFLDSQMAYLWIGVAIAAVGGWLLSRAAARGRGSHAAVILATLFGVGTAATVYNNKRLTDDMQRIAEVWSSARLAVCANGLAPPFADHFDPGGVAPMHEQVDRETFWSLYHDRLRPGCEDLPQ